MPTVKRTLVKSSPELWAEVSDPEALGAHFEAFGPIRITRTADAALVEWEGERAAGRLALEPSGFGTRVEIAAEPAVQEIPAPPAPEPPPAPPAPERGWFARRFRRAPEPPPAPPAPPAPEPIRIPLIEEDEVVRVMTATLDALGFARHRPFTR
jgi:hypothetical protein